MRRGKALFIKPDKKMHTDKQRLSLKNWQPSAQNNAYTGTKKQLA
jgi:hypothetical protein